MKFWFDIYIIISRKKILLIDADYKRLSKVSYCLISILYPFQWILEIFLPYLIEINRPLFSFIEKVFRDGEIQEDDKVFLKYISEDKEKIHLSSSLRGKKKKLVKYISDNVPHLPTQFKNI